MIERTIIGATVMGGVGFGIFYWMLNTGQNEFSARNTLLLLMVLFENIHIGNCRSESKSAFQLSPFRSPILLAGTVAAFLIHLSMMYLPIGNSLLATEPVDLKTWGMLIALSLTVLVAMEIHKLSRSQPFRNHRSSETPFFYMFRELVVNQTAFLLGIIQKCFNRFASRKVESTKVQQLRTELLEESTFDTTYLILIISSCIIATFGLLSNSAAVIIGAMIVAPLMLPIRGLAFGALEGDVILFRRGLISVVVGTLSGVTLALLLGSLAGISMFGSEILARSKPNLLDLGIAIAAGSISGYAKVQPKISGTLAGTAIAVALMPPICVIGLGLAHASWFLSLGALILYLTNLLGITLSCMVAFLLTGYTPFTQARKALVSATILTSVLLIPLGASFIDLVRQTRLENSLRQALLNRTITFQRVDLVKTETNWLVNPPEVRLTVRSQEAITPKQVELLEAFVRKSIGQPFTLIFEISQVAEVRREGISTPFQSEKLP